MQLCERAYLSHQGAWHLHFRIYPKSRKLSPRKRSISRKLNVGWPRIQDFQSRGHSCVNNVQQCLCHFYTWMRHSKQTATLLLTKRHANFDTSTSAKGYARVYELRMRNCSPWHTACSGSPHNALHSSSTYRIQHSILSTTVFVSCESVQ